MRGRNTLDGIYKPLLRVAISTIKNISEKMPFPKEIKSIEGKICRTVLDTALIKAENDSRLDYLPKVIVATSNLVLPIVENDSFYNTVVHDMLNDIHKEVDKLKREGKW